MSRALCLAASLMLFASASPAYAYDWIVDTKVTFLDPTVGPNNIAFAINNVGGSCPTGQFLTYAARGGTADERIANAQAVLATLLTAQARNATIRIYGNNAGCTVSFIWIFS